jgi:hypothetical protein
VNRRAFLAGLSAAIVLTGCHGAPIAPTYTQDELRAICERQRGWWHPDGLIGGHCEYDSRQ